MKELFTKDQRLVILRGLAEVGYDANESMLRDILDLYGHNISRDLVRNHLLWLEEQSLVSLKRLEAGRGEFFVAAITQRGLDVAQGRVVVEGVKRPSPKI